MPSPFPGMDPYLEAHWGDVHTSLVTYVRDALQESLPSPLRARVEERVVLEMADQWGSPIYPDIRVIEHHHRPGVRGPAAASTTTTISEPLLVEAERDPPTERSVEIVDPGTGNRVVTVIEILSATNKMLGAGMQQYLRKQRHVLNSQTNLVEIDLLRSGEHVLAFTIDHIPPEHRTWYMVCVRRVTNRPMAEVYPIPLQVPLPTIKIPLRPTDADVQLNLQALIERAYRLGGYDGDLNYAVPPDPPLIGDDEVWADQLLREKGLRP